MFSAIVKLARLGFWQTTRSASLAGWYIAERRNVTSALPVIVAFSRALSLLEIR